MQAYLKALALLEADLELVARERQYQERYYRLGLELGLDYPVLVPGLRHWQREKEKPIAW